MRTLERGDRAFQIPAVPREVAVIEPGERHPWLTLGQRPRLRESGGRLARQSRADDLLKIAVDADETFRIVGR